MYVHASLRHLVSDIPFPASFFFFFFLVYLYLGNVRSHATSNVYRIHSLRGRWKENVWREMMSVCVCVWRICLLFFIVQLMNNLVHWIEHQKTSSVLIINRRRHRPSSSSSFFLLLLSHRMKKRRGGVIFTSLVVVVVVLLLFFYILRRENEIESRREIGKKKERDGCLSCSCHCRDEMKWMNEWINEMRTLPINSKRHWRVSHHHQYIHSFTFASQINGRIFEILV